MKHQTFRRAAAPIIALCALLCFPGTSAFGQTFTKVTTGPAVTDPGASRSAHWIDYDKDGDLDLFVTNGKAGGENNVLYRNEGGPDHAFTRMNSLVVSQDGAPSDGATWGDYDNDGDDDLFVVNWYGVNNMLYRNEGDGTFTRIVAGPPVTDGGYSETASWGDYDNDGWLDLAVSNSAGDLKEFLYRNLGDGTFQKVTAGAIPNGAGASRGLTWVDYDNDGDLDLFVANESNQNEFLYRNMRVESGVDTFQAVTTGPVVTAGASSWSGSWGDYDNDGDLDLFVANTANQNNALFNNQGDGTFLRLPVGFGDVVDDSGFSASSAWVDADNDGDLDLYVSNAYGAPGKNFYYRNLLTETGGAVFERELSGAFVNDPGYTYGFAWGDFDEDGDMDLYCARTLSESQANALYRNDGNANHWVTIDCRGTVSNGSAIGARIRVRSVIGGYPVWQLRVIEGQQGYCGQTLQQHIGLQAAAVIDSLVIEWPSGIVERFANIPADQHYSVAEQLAIIPEPVLPAHQAAHQLPTTPLRWRKTRLGGPFHVQVSTDSTFGSGIVYDDSTVGDTTVTLDSLANTTTFYWRVRQTRALDKQLWSAVRSFVVGASTYRYGLDAKWNLVSVPVTVAQYGIASLFPGAAGTAFSYDGTAYAGTATLVNGPGYWLASPLAGQFEIAGVPRPPESLAVNAGWNLVGSRAVGIPASAVRSVPPGIIASPFFGYSGGYAVAESLAPFRGYWIRASAGGLLVLEDSAVIQGKPAAEVRSAVAQLLFTDARGEAQVLLASAEPGTVEEARHWAMPPPPPSGVFDARFASGTMLWAGAEGRNAQILLGSARYPVRITWRDNPVRGLVLCAGGTSYPLEREGEVTLPGPVGELSLAFPPAANDLPVEAELRQNFPNPFNPETTFEFVVPGDGSGAGVMVTLDVYDLLGRRVAGLVSARLPAGPHQATWNAGRYPDGVYYCRYQAGGVMKTRKLLLIK
jgi:hypothetical protein